MRYRLRLLLQEFDLPRGSTLIGRSYDCHVTIEDALVSRQHARIEVDGDQVTVFDLGSRNGVKVNGLPIKGSAVLAHGDRLRIGTQELVFTVDEARSAEPAKTTGFLHHCHVCRMPYPRESGVCPSCGAPPSDDVPVEPERTEAEWTFDLQLQVLDRALSMGRLEDAARILGRAQAQLDDVLARGERPHEKQVTLLLVGALRTSFQSRDARWAEWAAVTCHRLSIVPAPEVLGWFQQLYGRFPQLEGPIVTLVNYHRGRREVLSVDEDSVLSRLEMLTQRSGDDPFSQTIVSKVP